MSVFSFGGLHKYGRARPRRNYITRDEIMPIQEFDGRSDGFDHLPSTGNARSISACGEIAVVLSRTTLQTPRTIARRRTANMRTPGSATCITNVSTVWQRRSCARTASCSIPWIARSTSATTSSTSTAANVSNYVRPQIYQRVCTENILERWTHSSLTSDRILNFIILSYLE